MYYFERGAYWTELASDDIVDKDEEMSECDSILEELLEEFAIQDKIIQDLCRNLKIHDTILTFLEDNSELVIIVGKHDDDEIIADELIG
jgi:hypothetical protein